MKWTPVSGVGQTGTERYKIKTVGTRATAPFQFNASGNCKSRASISLVKKMREAEKNLHHIVFLASNGAAATTLQDGPLDCFMLRFATLLLHFIFIISIHFYFGWCIFSVYTVDFRSTCLTTMNQYRWENQFPINWNYYPISERTNENKMT